MVQGIRLVSADDVRSYLQIRKRKPLALPPNDNERILLEIEKWFEQ